MKKLFLICFVLFTGLIACQKPFDVAYPYDGDKFVIYGELDSDEVVRVKIDKTYPPTGAIIFDNSFLDQTLVTLYEDGQLIDTLRRLENSNFFTSLIGTKPKAAKSYAVKATGRNLKEAISENEFMLSKPSIAEISVLKDRVPSALNPQIPAVVVVVKLDNIPKNSAYIRFKLTAKYNDIRTSADVSSPKSSLDFENPCIVQTLSEYIFKTDCIRENEELRFLVESIGGLQSQPFSQERGNREINNIDVNISTVTTTYHDFFTNVRQENGIFAVLEGIGSTFTNVNNGYGAVLCVNATERNIKVQK